jgi:hypothetical protein
LLVATLRRASLSAADGAVEEVARIILLADSAFAHKCLMAL